MKKSKFAQLMLLLLLTPGAVAWAGSNDVSSNRTSLSQQTNNVKTEGVVVDAKGEPLIGVSILEQGTTNGTITDIDGVFSLQVSPNAVLEISYIGYKTQKLAVKPNLGQIVMHEDTEVLEEVVVTALGIKRSEKALSYNVQQVKGDELTTVKDANFMNALAGKVAGVNINASASGVGGATRVVMRGVKSIANNNNALYVIDGVPIFNTNNGGTEGAYSEQPRGEGISDLNPDDIESMSVLSGPSAAALYGSAASAGVILITTKKGKEGKVSVTVSNSTTFSKPFFTPKFQNSYLNVPGSFSSWGEKGSSSYGDYDPMGFFRTGTNIQNSASLSVGNEKNQTYLSVGTTNANGMLPNNEYERYNFSSRNTTKFLNDKLTLDVGFSFIIQKDLNLTAQGKYFNPLSAVYLFPRGENFGAIQAYETFDIGRNIYTQNWQWGDQGLQMQNPYWVMNRMPRTNNKQRYMANASLKYDITDWLNVTGRVRIDNSSIDYEEKRYASTNTLFASTTGFYKFHKTDDRQVYADIIANISKTWESFTLNANLGASTTQLNYKNSGYQGALGDMPNVFTYYNIDKNGRDTYPLFEGWRQRTNALFASVEAGWRNMLYLTVTGRNDWDSALAHTPNKSFFYPSVGLSGVISEMVKLPEWFSYLKVRGSYAVVGTSIPRNLTSLYSYEWDKSTGKWQTMSYKPLGELLPEKTYSWEAGINARFFDGKLNLDATWYKSDTKNQTIEVPLSATSGYTKMYCQSGNVRNWGMEFALGFNNTWGDFSWSSNVTYSFNRNKVTELLKDYVDETGIHYSVDRIEKGGIDACQYILTEGGTMGDLYVKTALKRDQNGNVMIENNNVVLETLSEPKKVGSVLPSGNLGFRNDFNYKGINLGFMFSARFGGVVLSQTQAIMDQFGVSETTAIARDNGGVPVNNGVIDAQAYYTKVGGSNGLLEDYVYDATNLRLQELSLGYTLPAKWFNDAVKINLSVVGRNLWMIYCKAPFDPEATASTGTYYQGLDYFMQPNQRSFGFNVKVQF